MGDQQDGGLGSLLGKANKWLSDQGVTHDDLAKAKADSERWEADKAAERESEGKADREARAGGSQVTMHGTVTGTVSKGLAVQTEREEGSLWVTVECVDAVPLSGGNFAGLTFVIPNYKGPGTYDLGTMDLSGEVYELLLDPAEEGFYWAPDYGPGVVTVSAGEATAEIRFVYQDPGSNRVELEGIIELT
jgi:hypothetical protein